MKPTRAAWFFAAGLVWLVLRGILVQAVPTLRADQIAETGGWLLLVPMVSVVAALTAPVFFISFLRHPKAVSNRGLRGATIFAAAASFASFALVVASFILQLRGLAAGDGRPGSLLGWSITVIPLLFVVSIFVFLLVFARRAADEPRLRRAAVVAGIGTSIPVLLITAWIIHSRFPGVMSWYPSFSQGLAAKLLGLAAAGTLLWFLETFALSDAEDGG